MPRCTTCENEGEHYIRYINALTLGDGWTGIYCTPCFVKKLRGMATVWSKK